MRVFFLFLVLVFPALPGARYKLAYKVKANDLIRMVANAADLKRWESPGDEVVLDGSKVFVKGIKTGFILDHAKNELIVLDHEGKTFERTTPAAMRARIAADFPPGIEGILRRMYPAEGKPSTDVAITVTQAAEPSEMKFFHQFRAKYGLSYLLPGVDSIVSFTPHLEARIAELGKGDATPKALRFAIGQDGRILDANVQVLEYQEGPIPTATFRPPVGYSDITNAPI